MRSQPLIAVTDVEASSSWYQRLLGCRSAHGGREYERLVAPDGTLILQLHSFTVEHDHGRIGDIHQKPYGNGLLLWFEIDDYEAAVARAADLKAPIVLQRRNPPDGNGGPNHWECWLRDPDGYMVVIASPDGSAS